jgi:hypothetical protein
MQQNGDAYEYIGVYVDNLAIIVKNAKEIIDVLENKWKFKLKGMMGLISFHLGMDFFHDGNGLLSMGSSKHYIEWMTSTGDHPECLQDASFSQMPLSSHLGSILVVLCSLVQCQLLQ